MRTLFQVALVVFGVVSVASAQVSVPFVGCPADGQQGPVVAPSGRPRVVALSTDIASKLAWYETSQDGGGLGVLAPQGWQCFGTYGSDGWSLYVAPEPLDADKVLRQKGWSGFTGPAIQLSYSPGSTSGRFMVAQIIARVFPAYRAFVRKIVSENQDQFPYGPFPTDKLKSFSSRQHHLHRDVVEFTTPAHAQGLGTSSWLLPGATPIEGIAVLFPQEEMDLNMLTVRLEANQQALARQIVLQKELDLLQPPVKLR